MHQTSTLPTAEITALPVRPRVAGQDEAPPPAVPIEPQVSPLTQGAETYHADRALHAMLARLSGGISPAALLLAYTDWLTHLTTSPQRQIEIAQEAVVDTRRFWDGAQRFFSPGQGPWSLIKPQPQDKRFGRPEWEQPPFNLMAQAFLLGQQWWHDATTGVRGVAKQNEAIVEFSIRQMLDVMSPSNFAATNPEVARGRHAGGKDCPHRGIEAAGHQGSDGRRWHERRAGACRRARLDVTGQRHPFEPGDRRPGVPRRSPRARRRGHRLLAEGTAADAAKPVAGCGLQPDCRAARDGGPRDAAGRRRGHVGFVAAGDRERIARPSRRAGVLLMEVLVFLVPLALTLGAIGLMGFLWSLKNGQYDDLEGAGWRAIADDEFAPEEPVLRLGPSVARAPQASDAKQKTTLR